MTPDEIITEIFRIQNERDPDSDPGDIEISIQDDMDLTIVGQWRIWPNPDLGKYQLPVLSDTISGTVEIGHGATIQEALENALKTVQENV